MSMPESLTLGLLPERKSNWRTFVASYGLVTIFVLLLVLLRLIFPERLLFRPTQLTELIPLPEMQKPEPPKPEIQKPVPPPPPVAIPKLVVPKPDLTAQKPPEPPKIVAEFKPPDLQPVHEVPPKLVYTGSFATPDLPNVKTPTDKIQTGAFGDPNGLPGTGKPGHIPVASAGFGSGMTQVARAGEAPVQVAGFAAQEFAQPTPNRKIETSSPTSPVEILAKPRPVYTDEARQLKLEGEVLLEVSFGANGQLHVNRVVRGLGHGLDEAAIEAANKIQFKPAARDGSPIDSTAVVHVIFQLAY